VRSAECGALVPGAQVLGYHPAAMPNVRNALVALILLAAASVQAQPLPVSSPESQRFSPERLARLHAMLERHVKEDKHAGVISLVARNGRLVDWQVYGLRDREQKLPMEKDTIVRIYSMSKVVTSVAVMILVEENRLKLTDPVGKYLPKLEKMKVFAGGSASKPKLVDAKRQMTVKDLLTHTCGFIYGFGQQPIDEIYRNAKLFESPSMDAFIDKVAALPLAHQPGERFSYGLGLEVLGAVIEKASGVSLEQFIEDRITRPLGMPDTSFDVVEAKRGRLARVYSPDKDGKLVAVPEDQMFGALPEPGRGFAAGGAGMFSTIGDYARFGQMLLNGGELDGVRILGRKTVELMMTNHLNHLARPPSGGDDAFCFGLGGRVRIDVAKGNAPGSLGQFGWSGAATTYFDIDPVEKTMILLVAQHFPFNQHDLFGQASTLIYAALVD
jgi:CubicO group peptidase (beta-lactamase class C family)